MIYNVAWNHLVVSHWSVRGLERWDSGCHKGEAAITAPSWSQLQTGRSTPAAQRPSSQWTADSSEIQTQDLQDLHASNSLSYLLRPPLNICDCYSTDGYSHLWLHRGRWCYNQCVKREQSTILNNPWKIHNLIQFLNLYEITDAESLQ